MIEDALNSTPVGKAETVAEINRLLREIEQMQAQNAENHRRIERARARTQENVASIRAQLDRMSV